MRSVLMHAARVVAAVAAFAFASPTWAQAPAAEPGGARPPIPVTPSTEVPAPRSPDASPATRPPSLGSRPPADAPPANGAKPQAPPTDTTPPTTMQNPPNRSRSTNADRAAPAASAASNVGPRVDPLRTNPSRATDPSNPVDPAADHPSKPADPTRAPEKSPRAETAPAADAWVRVAAREALEGESPAIAAGPALAACMRDFDRGSRARCAHDASFLDAPPLP